MCCMIGTCSYFGTTIAKQELRFLDNNSAVAMSKSCDGYGWMQNGDPQPPGAHRTSPAVEDMANVIKIYEYLVGSLDTPSPDKHGFYSLMKFLCTHTRERAKCSASVSPRRSARLKSEFTYMVFRPR